MTDVHPDDPNPGFEMFGTPNSQVSNSFTDEDAARSFFVRALYDFSSGDTSSLSFERGAVIEVLTQLESGWWDGLMGNDVRGWFPSNYVEMISDEEAEMELLMRENNQIDGSMEKETYAGLGLGQDFDVLQQMMSGMSSNDAFEQLAEEGMRGASVDSNVSTVDGRRTHSPEAALRSRLGPSEWERSRSHSIPVTSARTSNPSVEGRPRAATNSSLGSKTGTKRRNESDFWVPRVTERGEIVYFNTRTGAQSHDLPDGTEMGGEGGSRTPSSMAASDEESWSDQSVVRSLKSKSRRPLFGRHTSTIYADTEPGGRSRATSDSRPSTATSHQTSITMKSRKNGIENMPDPRDVPWPWVVRASDDEKTFYFYNRQTHDVSQDCPSMASEAATSVEDAPRRGPRKSRAQTIDSSEQSTALSREEDALDAALPLSRHSDERDAIELQLEMARGQVWPLHSLIDEANNAIGQLAITAAESIASDGLSEQDRGQPPVTSTLVDSSRLGQAIRHVVDSVRNLLYAAGSLAVSAMDLSVVSELAWLVQDDASLDVLKAFQGAMSALHGKGVLQVEPHIAVALQQATPAPPSTLTPLGKKINATLSKLVLSARSVIEQSCLNTSVRPELTHAQMDKITNYRQRIKDDSMELAQALGAFGIEADRSHVALGGTASTAWVKQVEGVLRSGRATAGIGLGVLGGGAAAGWRGNGFVLPSATEAAALRAETMGSYQNPFELTKDARNALSSGKISLRRKPTTVLSRQVCDNLIPQHSLLDDGLSRLKNALASGAINREDFVSLESEPQEGVVDDGVGINRLGSQVLLVEVRKLLLHVGALIVAVEDIDMATTLDVDGFEAGKDEYRATVKRARELLHRFAAIKQEMYDTSNTVFLVSQDAVCQANESPCLINVGAGEAVLAALKELEGASKRLTDVIAELVTVSEEQANDAAQGQMGARSKVYGIDDIKISAQKLTPLRPVVDRTPSGDGATGDESEEQEGLSEEVMYLGPGLAVPNGPPSAPARSASGTLKVAPQTGLRTRSTSVTTGASSHSHDSGSRAAKSGASGGPGEDDDGDSSRGQNKVNNKIKRFFGDDAPSVPSLRDTADTEVHQAGREPKAAEETPWFLEVDYSPEDVVMNATSHVKGATLGALMERLTMHNAFDTNFNTTFLMTYRSFSSTEELLDLLSARFRIREPPGLTREEHQLWVDQKQMLIRFRVFNVLKTWLESHFYEGEDDVHLKRIEHFVLDGMGQSPILATPGKHLIRLIERRSGKGEQMVRKMQLPNSTPAPILPKNFRKIKFLDIDPLEMARQLTLIDSRLYNRIRPVECLGKAWSRENGALVAKGIRDVISANNKVSGWVSEAILVQEDLKKRAAWVKQFVAIADRCHALNNFSSMMAIYSGLNNASLNRLRRTWDAVNQRHLQMFENMKNLLAPTKNFSKYRETLRMLNPPCVPFLGVYLTGELGESERFRIRY